MECIRVAVTKLAYTLRNNSFQMVAHQCALIHETLVSEIEKDSVELCVHTSSTGRQHSEMFWYHLVNV